MRGLNEVPDKPAWRRRLNGQSLVELALAMPVLLIMLSGLLEFGFALNQYLNVLDAAREGARFAADGDPTRRDLNASKNVVYVGDCSASVDFYHLTSCVAQNTMAPVPLNPATDDIVISVFRVLSGKVFGRWPYCGGQGHAYDATNQACPNDPPFLANPSTWPETQGEWHQWGRGDQCADHSADSLDQVGQGIRHDGCDGNVAVKVAYSTCNPITDFTCNPSRFTMAQIQAVLDPAAPNTAVVLVEVFYNYNQILKLPWITAFVPDPQRLHSYTIIPVPAAEPSLTISGTVTNKSDGSGKADVTIDFTNGVVAVTNAPDGSYLARGFDSTPITVTASFPGCTFTPANYFLVPVNDVANVDFVADCPATSTPTITATPTNTPNLTQTPTNTPTPTSTPTSTQTQTPTITPTPTSTLVCTPGVFDAGKSTVSLQSPVNGVVPSDGTSVATLVVTLLDKCSNPMPGQPVSMSSSRGNPPDIISPASAGSDTTNLNGQAFFTVSSSLMSPWDPSANAGNGDFTASVMSAHFGGTTLSDTRNVKFECVRGDGLPNGNNNEVFWQFTNNTGLTRRLVRVDVTWPQAVGRLLQTLQFNGANIWDQGTGSSPVTINSQFNGIPSLRDINDSSAKSLLVTFNFLVTGAQEFTVKAFWADSNNLGNVCDSGSVTVIRGGSGTAIPTNTSVPTVSPTSPASTPTRTPTATVPASTATSTPTLTPLPPTSTPTATPTATSTATPTATATATATPTATPTLTPVPPTPTNTATPGDVTGPTITNLVVGNIQNQSPNCTMDMTADISDPSGVNAATVFVVWQTFTSGGTLTGNGTKIMTVTVAPQYKASLSIPLGLLPSGGHLNWQVTAKDTIGNATTTGNGPTVPQTSCT